jgi:type I restriction enzyme, R subunit
MAKHTEYSFEETIVEQMVSNGWRESNFHSYDRVRCMLPEEVYEFILATQPKEWEKLHSVQGPDAKESLLQRISSQVSDRGTIAVLRKGIEHLGCHFRLCYFPPSSGLNEESRRLFESNILTAVRQLRFSTNNEKSIDMVLFVNGLPIFTAELKNPMTGQDVLDAVSQYKNDRNPKGEQFLQFGRCLAHFAVDTDFVQVTTKLEGRDTFFIPFNKGWDEGAGNPPSLTSYPTSYLWNEVWMRTSLLELLQHFLHHQPSKGRTRSGRTAGLGRLIFPRYHQLEATRRLVADSQQRGVGKKYLIQHSAGSGKSNTIAWLSHRLSILHGTDDKRVFDAIIILTDRKILDKQLQDTVRAFEQTRGVVAAIEGTSSQLKDALENKKQIIVTTLQKFPYIVNAVDEMSNRRFALVIDEAHSSQGGEQAQAVGKVLRSDGHVEEVPTYEDMIHDQMSARQKQDNISIFAFTATPKDKTLELFGKPRTDGPGFEAFSLYSMKQAIDEGFILDVLRNYTTYETYWKLHQVDEEDPTVEEGKAKAILKKFVREHPSTIKEKVGIMMDHYWNHTESQINGKAKAMIATSSRKLAVEYRLAVDRWIKENQAGFKAIVAFTETVEIDGKSYTENGMNGFPVKQTADRFNDDDNKILVVANKFQTGFDQPLLHTMYVDKKLGGVAAVQTLSRLNRVHPEKTETCVLDFANEADSIQEAFQPYYQRTVLEGETDPNAVYELRRRIIDFDMYSQEEAHQFCKILFDQKAGHEQLSAYLDSLVRRFTEVLDDEERKGFRKLMRQFVNGYSFLARIMPFSDKGLEEYYQFSRHIVRLLPVETTEMPTFIQELVNMQSLRISTTSVGEIPLIQGQGRLEPRNIVAGAMTGDEDTDTLSSIIEALNERFGANLDEGDRLFLEGVLHELRESPAIQRSLDVNEPDDVKRTFDHTVREIMSTSVDERFQFVKRFLDNNEFREDMLGMLFTEILHNSKLSNEGKISNLIAQGESKTVEWKSTLRYCIKTQQNKMDYVEHSVVKTIAAFLNTHPGGTLLIGVGEDEDQKGFVRGSEEDDFNSDDEAERHIINIVNRDIGDLWSVNVDPKAVRIDGLRVIKVKVDRASSPAWCKKGDELVFYVRQGPTTKPLSEEDAETYIKTHW